MITLTPSAHTDEDGIETHVYPSALQTREQHCISRTDGGPWQIAPVTPTAERDLTINETKRLVEEIRFLIRMAEKLERERAASVKRTEPCDTAVTAEVQSFMGDRGWSIDEAAAQFGWTRARLIHRVNGHSSWTMGDLGDVAAGFAVDEEDLGRIMEHLFTVARNAGRAAREAAVAR